MTKLEKGDKAPDFCLPDKEGNELCLKDLRGNYSVVYFYPKDNTKGCTMEAHDFTQQLEKFREVNVPVIGVSPDSPESHRRFAQKHDLKVRLLSDVDHTVLENYGVWKKKSMYGKEFYGVVRTTFILDPQGRVAAAWHKVKVPGHVDEVLEKLSELMRESRS